MAKLRDVAPVLRSFGIWSFCKRVWQQISEDGIFVWASALAYSWLFAIFPFLIFLLTLVPYMPFNTARAQRTTSDFISNMLGKAAPTLNDNIENILHQHRHGWLGIGLVVSLWAASSGMSMTMAALDQCYDIKHGRPYYKQRIMAVILTIIIIILVSLVLILLPVGDALAYHWKRHGVLTAPVVIAFNIARYGISILLMGSVLAIVYYFGPSIRQRFHPFSPGAVFTIVVWLLLDFVFRFYVDHFAGFDQTYGTVGGVAMLLLFFYFDAVVLLIGAEINSEIDFEVLGVPSGSIDFTGSKRKASPGKSLEIAPEL